MVDQLQLVLNEAGRVLTESIDYEPTLQNVATLFVPTLADWCMVELVQGDDLVSVTAMHKDLARDEIVQELRRGHPINVGGQSGAAHVIRTGQAELYEPFTEQHLKQMAHDEQQLQVLRRLKPCSGVVVPLAVGGDRLGSITLLCEQPRRYSEPQLPLLEALGGLCAVAIDNAGSHRELQRARADHHQMQQAMVRKERWREAILEGALDCIIGMDQHGRIVEFNPAAERTFGHRREDVIGRYLAETIIPERMRQAHWQGLKRFLDTGKKTILGKRIEMPALHAEGHEFPVELAVIYTGIDKDEPFFTGYLRDITERSQRQEQLEARARQQAAVAAFGQKALSGPGLQELFDEAVQIIAHTLDNELCKVLRLLPDGEQVQLEAGVGWQEGLVGQARVSTGRESQAGYTLMSDQPVVVKDLRTETRFSGPPLLHEHGVVSGVSVIIRGERGRAWGVLGTHTRQRRDYSHDDVNFLQAMSNILATAIHRHNAEQRLQSLNENLEQRVNERTAELRQRAAQLQAMSAQLTQAEQRERRRLAEVLHDHLQQLLAAAKMRAGRLGKHIEDPRLQQQAAKLEQLLSESIDTSRNLTLELSPPILYERGLVPALKWLSRWMEEQYELVVDLKIEQEVKLDNEDLRILAFQSVRELLFNTIKHAGIKKAQVHLRQPDESYLEITVVDPGKGFEGDQLQKHQRDGGFGLFSIHERLELIGGRMDWWSEPGQGAKVTLLIPFRRRMFGREMPQ